ncbi:hypothetical protein GYMLUDRAFT_97989 [Collybiopsis luxurians FD-317 M1]|uniref:Unplaced genomic scaffold GYMLUscaffold_35, whole genome shotgun sequence n=1 Tax=Collybiopsis luxurians FD-317 M1 TaxID=944289 RepID=A0A0D0CST5_9AGAR|nr:hypothetical protein GYMLUDRAFT_97989 [Collybiopsis luxurians FD-317 M1]
MSLRSSYAESISRLQSKHRTRVSSDVTVRSVTTTFTTVTVEANAPPSAPTPGSLEDNQAVARSSRVAVYRKILKRKVQRLLRPEARLSTSAIPTLPPTLRSTTFSSSRTTLFGEDVTHSRRGSSLFHFKRSRSDSGALKAGTASMLDVNSGPAKRSNSLKPTQVRRSRSFNDTDRPWLAARFAFNKAAQKLAASSSVEAHGQEAYRRAHHPTIDEVEEEVDQALERAARELAEDIRVRRSSRYISPTDSNFRHCFPVREWEIDEGDTPGCDAEDGDLDGLLDEATREAYRISALIGNQNGFVLDQDGYVVRKQ